MTTTHRINLWAGPRNISTALMYSFAQRPDTVVYDEPLYAHYLSKTPAQAYHPGADEVLANMENDGKKVVRMMQEEHRQPVAFFKQMTHHLVELDWSFMHNMQHIILTRDPRDMLPSYAKQVATPSMVDVGYAAHLQLINYLENIQKPFVVLDSKSVLQDPKAILSKLCLRLGIPFTASMLKWPAGARPEDGVWAHHWYASVHQSTGFAPYRPKTAPFPTQLMPLLKECLPIYEQLAAMAVK